MSEKKILLKIGKKIKDIRRKNDMSQNELAAQCNFEKASMSRIESGQSNMTIRTLLKISSTLKIQLSDLFAN